MAAWALVRVVGQPRHGPIGNAVQYVGMLFVGFAALFAGPIGLVLWFLGFKNAATIMFITIVAGAIVAPLVLGRFIRSK
jgi:hypothetical protein